ncbi:hypothetical protein Q7M48_05440 (plasmid) [Candidatus Liberibacter asiaticus]|uniref:Bbp19-like phage domain-containing protein n=2 Tax=Liberibacter asiaticus TaxID=34021 RepID=E7DUR5_LIBAS|nr:hypothetical protein [Candidatus Liberibacter asiaticus]YP_007011111.1 hypothetical protein F489_gp16 [Liberibacter phage SC2]AEL31365.1 hypothetical protein Psy-FP2_gm110 [Liberibacter phage FP2]APD21488.1 hypothetical protein PHHCA_gp13 [Liberibacter phage HHCA1-2]QOI69831.1 major capsid protein [Liberibacter phage P-PA19-2]ADV02542.1 hypothetical protein SC2_gp100 [Liberibacter phage SC2]ADV02602.1 hypothetical protein SC2_gp100 [Candidatus Liberibacter asiaticus]
MIKGFDEVEKAEKVEQVRRYKSVFATFEGRWVLLDIMREGGLLATELSNDPIALARREGKRTIALYITDLIALEAEELISAYRELEQMEQ